MNILTKWRNFPHKILVIIFLLLGLTILPTISGCEYGSVSPIKRVIQVFGDLQPLPEKTELKLQEFAGVFRGNVLVADDIEDYLQYFRFAVKRIRTSYVKVVDEVELIDSAIKAVKQSGSSNKAPANRLIETSLDAMTESLDPHSSYLNASEFKETFIHTKGEFGGLGIEVTMQDGLVKVISPIEGTPAERAGLKSGDLIVSVDGKPIKGLSLAAAVLRMRGAPGEPIDLMIRRKGRPDFSIELVRAVITVRAVRWGLLGDVAYIRVTRFSEKVKKGLSQAFASIRKQLDGQLTGVILDLRNNPGGLLEQSVVLADAFLDDGKIVSVRGRKINQQSSFEASYGDLANGLPLVVLVNSGSASASEIVISALKTQKRATIMGSKTFGKGSVQTIIPMPREGALRLTTALYYGADGQSIQARGILPNILVETTNSGKLENRREADLPGAIPIEKTLDRINETPTVLMEKCPVAYKPDMASEQKNDDKLLGCALGYLKAGSEEKFLASFGAQNKI